MEKTRTESSKENGKSLFHQIERSQIMTSQSPRLYRAFCSNILVERLQLQKIIGTNQTGTCLFCLRLNEEGNLLASTTGFFV